jgi:hypothetical protein
VAKTWVLDTETKGTGAQVRPLDDVLEKPVERRRHGARPSPGEAAPATKPRAPQPAPRRQTSSTPLAKDQVRKKSTGEIGKLRSVDPRTGTAVVHWLRAGRTTTVPLTAISRR